MVAGRVILIGRVRRSLIGVLVLIAPLATHPASASPALVEAVDAIAVTVGDIDRSIAFFSGVLDFRRHADIEVRGDEYSKLFGVPGARIRIVTLQLGDERIELQQFLSPRGRPMPPDSRADDRWFQHIAIITNDMDAAYARLQKHNVEPASQRPQTLPTWNQNAAGIRAYYFRDPDGHFLEILQFPPGKGDPKWHRSSDRLFLGIDHTAIVVADTDISLAFYHDTLGMRIAGNSENYGIEQERLNNVEGARLRITTLRAAQGPGIELLEYLSPDGGRSAPPDSRANDLWHWHVRVRYRATADLDGIAAQRKFARVSSHHFRLPDSTFGFGTAQLGRDPDGHALLLTAP
ncbi:MAG TPA: VOC family protein [Phycisphaerae bacterium]|nr:VOC family protein [Phycisphaerae bacterium]